MPVSSLSILSQSATIRPLDRSSVRQANGKQVFLSTSMMTLQDQVERSADPDIPEPRQDNHAPSVGGKKYQEV
jgi:hypothetical protein